MAHMGLMRQGVFHGLIFSALTALIDGFGDLEIVSKTGYNWIFPQATL
jgi:hypothetical protein